jgi:hypothetical protein
LLEDIKKYLDKSELPKLLGVFKEIKDCESMEPVFKRLKVIFFGKVSAPSKQTDRFYEQKIKCLMDLGDLIPKKKQEEYRVLMESLRPPI